MATKVVAKLDWSKLSSRVNKKEIQKLNKLKAEVDATLIKLSTLPDKLPAIDWDHYKANASDPKIVEELEKQYSKLKVDMPKAKASVINELDLAKEQDIARFKKFETIAQSYISSADVLKEKFTNMIPVPRMNEEDWALTFPYWSFSNPDNPSLAPHWGRHPGLSREEAALFEQPDPIPYATKTAWKDWEERKKKYYS